jgi:hypothetical protein
MNLVRSSNYRVRHPAYNFIRYIKKLKPARVCITYGKAVCYHYILQKVAGNEM